MALTREYINSRRTIIPMRISVRVHSIVARDGAPVVSGPYPAERRPIDRREQRSQDAAGQAFTNQYCFFQSELNPLVLKEGDVIEDIELGTFHAIDSLSIELVGVRVKANCYANANPSIAVQ